MLTFRHGSHIDRQADKLIIRRKNAENQRLGSMGRLLTQRVTDNLVMSTVNKFYMCSSPPTHTTQSLFVPSGKECKESKTWSMGRHLTQIVTDNLVMSTGNKFYMCISYTQYKACLFQQEKKYTESKTWEQWETCYTEWQTNWWQCVSSQWLMS